MSSPCGKAPEAPRGVILFSSDFPDSGGKQEPGPPPPVMMSPWPPEGPDEAVLFVDRAWTRKFCAAAEDAGTEIRFSGRDDGCVTAWSRRCAHDVVGAEVATEPKVHLHGGLGALLHAGGESWWVTHALHMEISGSTSRARRGSSSRAHAGAAGVIDMLRAARSPQAPRSASPAAAPDRRQISSNWCSARRHGVEHPLARIAETLALGMSSRLPVGRSVARRCAAPDPGGRPPMPGDHAAASRSAGFHGHLNWCWPGGCPVLGREWPRNRKALPRVFSTKQPSGCHGRSRGICGHAKPQTHGLGFHAAIAAPALQRWPPLWAEFTCTMGRGRWMSHCRCLPSTAGRPRPVK